MHPYICFTLTSDLRTLQTLAVLGFVGKNKEDQDCIQGLRMIIYHHHHK